MIALEDLPAWFQITHHNGCDCRGTLEGLERCGAAKQHPQYEYVIAALRKKQREAVAS